MKTHSQTAIRGGEWRTIEEVMEFCEITPMEEGRIRALLEIARHTSLPFRAYHAAHVACAQVVRERAIA